MNGGRVAGRARSVAAAVCAAALILGVPAAGAEGLDFSGTADTTFASNFGAGGAPERTCGLEQYANLRLKAPVGERGTFYAAANLIAASGSSASEAEPFVAGENYAAAIELERLYYRIESESADLEAGLMRQAFGYGEAWSPCDFLNPKNPLTPEARRRGAFGAAVSAYPADTAKLRAFAVSGADSLDAEGGGAAFGFSAEGHWKRASLQGLYAYGSPAGEASGNPRPDGTHYCGAALKLEAGAAIVMEALYALDPAAPGNEKNLQATAGADYSFLGGDLYVLLQYLYNGSSGPDTSMMNGSGDGQNFAYVQGTYRFDDYTSAALSCVASIDDGSFSPYAEISHEPFQGMTASLGLRVPFGRGELGPEETESRAAATAKAKLRF